MSLAKRKDFGVRVAGEKAQLPDEFLTRSQVIAGTNITFDYLSNHDIRINAITSGGGGTGGLPRYILADITLMNKFNLNESHIDIQDTGGSVDERKYFGTHVYIDIHHFWGLVKPDAFIYTVLDHRQLPVVTIPYYLDSLPTVIGMTEDTIRIIATDAKTNTRFDPKLWVDTESGNMLNTRFVFSTDVAYEHARQKGQIELTPRYIIRIEEVISQDYTVDDTVNRDVIS